MLLVDVGGTSCPEELQWKGYDLQLGEHLASGKFASVRAVRVRIGRQTKARATEYGLLPGHPLAGPAADRAAGVLGAARSQ